MKSLSSTHSNESMLTSTRAQWLAKTCSICPKKHRRTYCSPNTLPTISQLKSKVLAKIDRLYNPEEPDPASCCGNGCDDCVWVVFAEDQDLYKEKKGLYEVVLGKLDALAPIESHETALVNQELDDEVTRIDKIK